MSSSLFVTPPCWFFSQHARFSLLIQALASQFAHLYEVSCAWAYWRCWFCAPNIYAHSNCLFEVAVLAWGLFSKQMVIPVVKGIKKMGVRENAKKGIKNGKEITRVKISCTFQLIWMATFSTPTPPKNNRPSCLKVILSLKPQVLGLSAPQTAALFTLPKWCIKMSHSVMAVLNCATTPMFIGTNMLQGSQMWHGTQKIKLKCFFLLAVLHKGEEEKKKKNYSKKQWALLLMKTL